MNLVLCMAGLYKRFKEKGYTTPKFLLPWQEQTILSHILTLMLADKAFTRVILVANERDRQHSALLLNILSAFNELAPKILFTGDTKGQAETAKIACEYLVKQGESDERIIFHNIDTLLLDRNYTQYAHLLNEHDGLIDIFEADSPCYSYVVVDKNRIVKQIAEKRVISPWATSGLYGFKSYQAYLNFAMQAEVTGQEFYISDIYQHMLSLEGCRIVAPYAFSPRQSIVLGTPVEYETAVNAL